jgi:DNA-binding NarL/FixJ family response regulator
MNQPDPLSETCSRRLATRVFVVEDSAIILVRLLAMLRGVPGVEVIGHAESAGEAIDKIVAAGPDAVVLDLKLKGSSGMKVLEVVKQRMPAVAIIILTNYATAEYRRLCMDAGAEYFLDKTNEFQNLPSLLGRLNCH